MKQVIFILILVVMAGGLLFWLVENNEGSVLISTQNYVVQFSLWTALITALVAIMILRLTYAALRGLLAPGFRLVAGRKQRRQERWRKQNNRGLLAFAEGRWAAARQDLLKTADRLDEPGALISYVAAANAAAQDGEIGEALATLQRADGAVGTNNLAVGLTRARMFLDEEQYQQALQVLSLLRTNNIHHPYVLALLAQAYQSVGDWDQLEKLLPDLLGNKVVDKAQMFEYQVQIRSAQLQSLAQSQQSHEETLKQVEQLWSRTQKVVKADPVVLGQYVQTLESIGEGDVAETILRKAISKNWSNKLVLQYGDMDSSNPVQQLITAEKWLRAQPNNSDLLLVLGRLCKSNKLWGKGRDYLEASLRLQNRPETCAELAEMMTMLGEDEQSKQYFKRGLLTSLGLGKDQFGDELKAEPVQ